MLRRGRGAGERGFTLIEMMIVVAIIGVLASAAIPMFLRYMENARDIEGLHNVQKIADGVRTYFEAHNRPPASSCSGTLCSSLEHNPAIGGLALCQAGKQFHDPASVAEFRANPVWKALLFQPEGNFRFTYWYQTTYQTTNPASLYVYPYTYRYVTCSGWPNKWVWFQMWLSYAGGTVRKKGPRKNLN